jgi:hypothetical protein
MRDSVSLMKREGCVSPGLPDGLGRERVLMVLADAGELRTFRHQRIQPVFIAQHLAKFFS